MASEKPVVAGNAVADNAVAFAQLFDSILAYITYNNNNNNAKDLQTLDEMFHKIDSYAPRTTVASAD